MRNVIVVIVSVCFTLSVFAQETWLRDSLRRGLPSFEAPVEPWQQPAPIFRQSSGAWNQGLTIAAVGGGLVALGAILAATSGENIQITVTEQHPLFGLITTTGKGHSVNNGKRYGGVGLAGLGGVLVWWGLSRQK